MSVQNYIDLTRKLSNNIHCSTSDGQAAVLHFAT